MPKKKWSNKRLVSAKTMQKLHKKMKKEREQKRKNGTGNGNLETPSSMCEMENIGFPTNIFYKTPTNTMPEAVCEISGDSKTPSLCLSNCGRADVPSHLTEVSLCVVPGGWRPPSYIMTQVQALRIKDLCLVECHVSLVSSASLTQDNYE
ncbi:uncharacterized protein LOC135225199 [Macrobrachium nipponense]|uniref:uncharacterized protein LOC135225199 n=1 Tax=Macrobrachium nipponense TaxID=159736 RepID=UPI0030C8B548